MDEKKCIYTVQAVDSAFLLLDILSNSEFQVDLPFVAGKLSMTRNKASRLLATLSEKELVERDKTTGYYHLGIASISLAQKMLRASSVINLAHPIMEELAYRHDEAVYLTVCRGDEVLFLDMVDCKQQIKATALVGEKFPFFTNAAGKVIKALESRELSDWLYQKKYKKNVNMPNPETLASELIEIRSNGGIAFDNGGIGEGISTVAVAVKDYAGKVIGAVAMLGPSFRMMKERIENEIIPSLTEGAAVISEKLGYMPA